MTMRTPFIVLGIEIQHETSDIWADVHNITNVDTDVAAKINGLHAVLTSIRMKSVNC